MTRTRAGAVVAAAMAAVAAGVPTANGATTTKCSDIPAAQDVVPTPGATNIRVQRISCSAAKTFIRAYQDAVTFKQPKPKGWSCKSITGGSAPTRRCSKGSGAKKQTVTWKQVNAKT